MSAAPESKVSSGLVLGRYRVLGRMAKGGMGVVYMGRLEGGAGFAKPVVIKRINAESADADESRARFVREAQILSNLQHPNIVAVLDFGEDEQGHSMVLEYVHGYDLGRWLKYLQVTEQQMHWEEAVFIALGVLDALSYAHGFRRPDGTRAGVLHRDISPGNVLIDLEGRVRLLDFGIARMAEGPDGSSYKTQTGVLKGKIAFLAPELFSALPPSPKSDLYACAVLLYQMIAGKNPFAADNDSKVMWRVIMESPSRLAEHNPLVPPELDAAIARALVKDPELRQASADVFATELRRTLVRTEAEVAASLRARVRADFEGEMPELLKIERLSVRDRAWRGTEDGAAAVAAPASSTASTTTFAGEPSSISAQHRVPMGGAPESVSGSIGRSGVELPPLSQVGLSRSTDQPRAVPWKPMLVAGAAMGAVLASALVAAALYLRPGEGAPAQRFIVVETPEPSGAAAASSAGTTASGAPPAVAAAHVRSSVVEPPPTPARSAERKAPSEEARRAPEALSRRFSQQESALEACFEAHTAALHGTPEISVAFDVDEHGKVSSARLHPAALNDTPLGRCLGAVAQRTRFGELGKPLRFSIPLRARAARR